MPLSMDKSRGGEGGGNLARTLLTSALGKDKDSAAGKCILGSLGISDTGGNRKGAGKYLSRGAEEKDKILRELTAATTDMVENTRAGKAA